MEVRDSEQATEEETLSGQVEQGDETHPCPFRGHWHQEQPMTRHLLSAVSLYDPLEHNCHARAKRRAKGPSKLLSLNDPLYPELAKMAFSAMGSNTVSK